MLKISYILFVWYLCLFVCLYGFCLGSDPIGKSFPTFHTHQRTLTFMLLISRLSVRSSVGSVPYQPGLEPGTANPLRFLLDHSCFLYLFVCWHFCVVGHCTNTYFDFYLYSNYKHWLWRVPLPRVVKCSRKICPHMRAK